jgi:hypothetical protein
VDVLRIQSGLQKRTTIHPGKVQKASVTFCPPQTIQGMPGDAELVQHFAADAVTAGSDGGSHHGLEIFGSTPEPSAKGFHPRTDDSRSGAAPARVQDGSGAAKRIEEHDRHTVG